MRIENPNTYAAPKDEVHKLTVEFVLDRFSGAWHQPEDLMKWIAQCSYVKAVTLVGPETVSAEEAYYLPGGGFDDDCLEERKRNLTAD